MFLNKLAEEDKADVRRKEDRNTVKEKRGGGLETRKEMEKEEVERQQHLSLRG